MTAYAPNKSRYSFFAGSSCFFGGLEESGTAGATTGVSTGSATTVVTGSFAGSATAVGVVLVVESVAVPEVEDDDAMTIGSSGIAHVAALTGRFAAH